MDDSGRLLYVVLRRRWRTEWHGRNLDALWDSLTGGDINQRNPPFRIRISGAERMSNDAREIVRRVQELVLEAAQQGEPIEIEVLP